MGPSASRELGIERTERYGLFELHDDPLPALALDAVPYSVDIVAIHGITGDAYQTWTHEETNKLWLRDFVPTALPGARVFTFGYPADIFQSLDTGHFEGYARQLLNQLDSNRTGTQTTRPIIFVCYSMGGIVVKKALVIACLDHSDYGEIHKAVKGIMFMATPHRGSGLAQFPDILAKITRLATKISGNSLRTDLLRNLGSDAKVLSEISTDFRNQYNGVEIATFYEQQLVQTSYGISTLIVEEESAKMDTPKERLYPMPGCDHMSICKFSSEESQNYKLIRGVLRKWADAERNVDVAKQTVGDQNCLRSLAFPEMSYRRIEADRAHKGTCEWVLTHKNYNTWLQKSHGLLWIKGKPGSGKSTILAYLYKAHLEHRVQANDIVLCFFFHARGSSLQRTKIGMFRSLLYQLYSSSAIVRPSIRSIFEDYSNNFGSIRASWEWHLDELKRLFNDAMIATSKLHRVTIFVDALDEAGAEAAHELAVYFHGLDTLVDAEGSMAKLCISCRQYPVITKDTQYDIWVDRENHGDINLYSKDRFILSISNGLASLLSENELEGLQQDIVRRASGIFQWAKFAVGVVIDRSEEGDSFSTIQQQLTQVPVQLNELYGHILKNLVGSRRWSKILALMQLVAFSTRPLSSTELLHGMACIAPSVFGPQELIVTREDPERTKLRAKALFNSLSGALVEVKAREYFGSDGTVVQFIHESVRQYLLSEGLSLLSKNSEDYSSDNLMGRSHADLATSCIRYLKQKDIIIPRKYLHKLSMDLEAYRDQHPDLRARLATPFIA
ncbi:Protein SERAC1 [Lachnellula suecica]|uniref:Protein SERAC1 n=1 Tax=Lachnellula suecica TaxID=602035 RepID=A0A8T9CHU4_9HELO|nr:Protein SERAC1 [Lachnellula suecica]